MTGRRTDDFDRALAGYDAALHDAARSLGAGAARARRQQADGARMVEPVTADMRRWTARFQGLRQGLAVLPGRLQAERLSVDAVARRVLWGWPAIRLRTAIILLWIRVYIVAILILSTLAGLGAAGYAYRAPLAALVGGPFAPAPAKPAGTQP